MSGVERRTSRRLGKSLPAPPTLPIDSSMAERSFEQSIEIRVAPEVVHAFLADLHRHRELHPLIERSTIFRGIRSDRQCVATA